MCERYSIGCLSHTPNQTPGPHNPAMCPDWESNQQHFSSQAGTQSTEPQQPGKETPLAQDISLHKGRVRTQFCGVWKVTPLSDVSLGAPPGGLTWEETWDLTLPRCFVPRAQQ